MSFEGSVFGFFASEAVKPFICGMSSLRLTMQGVFRAGKSVNKKVTGRISQSISQTKDFSAVSFTRKQRSSLLVYLSCGAVIRSFISRNRPPTLSLQQMRNHDSVELILGTFADLMELTSHLFERLRRHFCDPPPLRRSTVNIRKRRIRDGEQLPQTGRD